MNRQNGDNRVQITTPNKPEYVGVVRLAVAGIASRMRFDYETIEDLKLAVAEAFTIAMKGTNAGSLIDVECEIGMENLSIAVRNTQGLLSAATDELGIFLIRALMDEVEIQETPRLGSRVVMKKYLNYAKR